MQVKFLPIVMLYFGVLFMSIAISDEKDETPNLDFLIFLGTFEDSNGKWQDPLEIDQIPDQDDELNRNGNKKHKESDDE